MRYEFEYCECEGQTTLSCTAVRTGQPKVGEYSTHTVELRELPVAHVQVCREPLLNLFRGRGLRPEDAQLASPVLRAVADLCDVGLEGVDGAAPLLEGKVVATHERR